MEGEKILVMVSNKETENLIGKSLKEEGFSPLFASDGAGALELACKEHPQLTLLEVDSSRPETWEWCRRFKEREETRDMGIILISSNGNETDKIKGFELGADDFLTKPFGMGELIARIKALCRRLRQNNHKIRVKDLEIDLAAHQVKKAGKPIDLTYIQFKLLYLLASRRENVFSRKEILEKVWGNKVCVTNRTVDVHIKRLREKLGERKYPSQYIETIHGIGYRFM